MASASHHLVLFSDFRNLLATSRNRNLGCIVATVKWMMGTSRRESDPEQRESARTEMQPPPAYDAGKDPAVQIEEENDALPSQPLPVYML